MQRFQVWFFVIKHQPVFAAQLVHYFEEKVRDQRLHSFSAFIANSILRKKRETTARIQTKNENSSVSFSTTLQYINVHCTIH